MRGYAVAHSYLLCTLVDRDSWLSAVIPMDTHVPAFERGSVTTVVLVQNVSAFDS